MDWRVRHHKPYVQSLDLVRYTLGASRVVGPSGGKWSLTLTTAEHLPYGFFIA